MKGMIEASLYPTINLCLFSQLEGDKPPGGPVKQPGGIEVEVLSTGGIVLVGVLAPSYEIALTFLGAN